MGFQREASLNHSLVIDPEPMPDHIPAVEEVGASSAPLTSAAYFIGARCQPYNDDFMLCKDQGGANGPIDCLKEGRRVTRCASSVISDINKYCSESFRLHWQCLNNNNYDLYKCRKAETLLNKCVFDNLKLEKKIPNAEVQVHLKEKPLHQPFIEDQPSYLAYEAAKKEGKL